MRVLIIETLVIVVAVVVLMQFARERVGPLAPTSSVLDKLIAERCKVMPTTAACAMYTVTPSTPLSRSTNGLPLAMAQKVLELRDGDHFTLTTDMVRNPLLGADIRMFAYNGQLPGPLLLVKQGSRITVDVVNNLDQATTVHWHGLRLDNEYDGVPEITQDPIEPGETYRAVVAFPDRGLFWYHPHVREDYQQEVGLYGPILVYDGVQHASDIVLMLDDIALDSDVRFFADRVDHALMGRFGDELLVNMQREPTIAVTRTARLNLANAAGVRVFNLSIPNAHVVLVGMDNGFMEHGEVVTSVILGPSERAILDVDFPADGQFELQHHSPERSEVMAVLAVAGDAPRARAPEFDATAYRQYLLTEPNKTYTLGVDIPGIDAAAMHHGSEGIEWEDPMKSANAGFTNESLTWFLEDEDGKRNMNITTAWSLGSLVKVRLVNAQNGTHPMQHPIHFHGNRFLVLAVDGVPVKNFAWKDTVLVPIGSTIDILLEASNPGEWLVHCHIPEHMESGMMSLYSVLQDA